MPKAMTPTRRPRATVVHRQRRQRGPSVRFVGGGFFLLGHVPQRDAEDLPDAVGDGLPVAAGAGDAPASS